jgi:hypothetical protein
MLQFDMSDVMWMDEDVLVRRIQQSSDRLCVTMTIDDLYRAGSIQLIADNWLKTWFIAESLADCASVARCDFHEGDRGAGNLVFDFESVDAERMAAQLLDFAAVFDPDDLEAGALIYDEATDWLENKGDHPSRFPEIEECYRVDAEQAAEKENPSSQGDDNEVE